MTTRKKMSARKPRPDCKLNALSAARRNAIFEQSKTTSIEELTLRIRAKDGISISATAVGNWLKTERIVRRASSAASVARQVVAALKEAADSGDMDAAIETLAKERAFDALSESGDAAEVAALVRIVNEGRRLKIDEKKLSILERKAKIADEIEQKAKSRKLSPEEALALIREKFGWRK